MGQDSTEATLTSLERYRGRAWSLAGLSATGAGALAAGLVLSPIKDELPKAALALGGVCMGLLLTAVLVTGYAMLVTRKRRKLGDKTRAFSGGSKLTRDETDPELLERVLNTVHIATRIGAASGALALAALGGTAWVSLVEGNPSVHIDVSIRSDALAELRATCPDITSPLRGEVTAKSLKNKDDPWLSLKLEDNNCPALSGAVNVSLPKEAVSLIVAKR